MMRKYIPIWLLAVNCALGQGVAESDLANVRAQASQWRAESRMPLTKRTSLAVVEACSEEGRCCPLTPDS